MIARASLVVVFASMVVGCSDADVRSPPGASGAASIMSTASAKGVGVVSGPEVDLPIVPVAFDVLDRVDKVRDPFQHDLAAPPCKPGEACDPARRDEVAFGDVEVGSLRVRGTASAGGAGHAIIADSAGRTRVVMPGERIGLASLDKTGNLTEWSVDRIRNGDVVLHEVQSGYPTGKTFVLGGSS
jgi:hypothetical protein